MAEIKWGKKFEQLRYRHRYTQEHVAEALGLKQNSYSLLESGTSAPKPQHIEKIAKLYGMTVDELTVWEPGTVNQSHNNVANAYTTVHQQHVVSQEFVQDLMARFDKRFEDATRVNSELLRLNQQLVEAMANYFKGQKAGK